MPELQGRSERGMLDMNLNAMTVKDLRTHARENRDLHDMTGVEIISLSKDALIARLHGEPKAIETGGARVAGDDLASAIAAAIEGKLAPSIDYDLVDGLIEDRVDEVKSWVNEQLKDQAPNRIEVSNLDTGKVVDIGLAHHRFENLLHYANARIHLWLVGESGSGKSHLVSQIAQALGLPFYPQSVGMQTSKSDLFGFVDAMGKETRTPLREAFEFGGVYCLDEADAGNANVLTMLNAMLSNGWAIFGNTVVQKHDDFICIACANTYGKGADMIFVGRIKLDGATLNRFAFKSVDIDEDLEMALAPDKDWCRRVQQLRASVVQLREKVIVSPRASISGGKMTHLESYEELEDTFIFQGANPDVKRRILAKAEEY